LQINEFAILNRFQLSPSQYRILTSGMGSGCFYDTRQCWRFSSLFTFKLKIRKIFRKICQQ